MAKVALFSDSRDPRSGGVIGALLFIVLIVAAVAIYMNSQKSREPSPFQAVDEILGDEDSSAAPDVRAEKVRMKLSELKAERAKVDESVRETTASTKKREADIALIKNEIAAITKRIERLKEEYREDPTDEEVKNKLYSALVNLKGGEGVEGLETRQQRALAALKETVALSKGLERKLASLNSAIATAESKGQTVVDYVQYGKAKVAVENARDAIKDIDGLAESTEDEAIDIAAEDEAAKARRDAALKSLLDNP